jgi:1-acyl-sn-glycerol-3-phosphate acyltransferase
MHYVYYFGRFLTRLLLLLLTNWQVKGRENIPDRGPLLIVCNHLHAADPPIVAVSVRLKAVFMAKEELFRHRWSRFWVRNFGAFPVHRGVPDRKALSEAEHRVKQGFALIMFPEGKRSSTIQMQAAFPGSALIASRLDVPILPVSISGTEKLKRLTGWLCRPRITVNIGEPFRLPPAEGKLTRAELIRLTNSIMEHIAGLLPPEYQGAYARGENAEDRESR